MLCAHQATSNLSFPTPDAQTLNNNCCHNTSQQNSQNQRYLLKGAYVISLLYLPLQNNHELIN